MESKAKQTNQKNNQRYREQISGCQRQEVGDEMGEGGQNLQTFSYKINKSWGCNIQHGDSS